jgi:hypothetical protein
MEDDVAPANFQSSIFHFQSSISNLFRNFADMRKVMVAIFAALALWSCGGDRDAMRERLDYVSQCNRADTMFTEAWLSTVDSLVRFFDRHGNVNERMMAHYLQGRVHHDMGEAPIALNRICRKTIYSKSFVTKIELCIFVPKS